MSIVRFAFYVRLCDNNQAILRIDELGYLPENHIHNYLHMSPTTSDSDIIFESLEVKRNYALVLTNWVIENYNVENDVTKRQIFEELFILPDVSLLEKGKMIEEFLDIRIIDSQF